MFGHRPSDVAYLGEEVTPLARFCFDRGVWAFGQHVDARLDDVAADTRNQALARYARQREWERLMCIDSQGSQFASPSPTVRRGDGAASSMFLDEVAGSPEELRW